MILLELDLSNVEYDGIPKTLREIGDILGVSASTITKIETEAMRKLLHPKNIRLFKRLGLDEYAEMSKNLENDRVY